MGTVISGLRTTFTSAQTITCIHFARSVEKMFHQIPVSVMKADMPRRIACDADWLQNICAMFQRMGISIGSVALVVKILAVTPVYNLLAY